MSDDNSTWKDRNKERIKRVNAEWKRKNRDRVRAYSTWNGMLKRCYDPKNRAYHWYGGRGITVCERWRGSFEAFLADMGFPPPGRQIDRIDNAKGYSPDNCRWADVKTQARNRRNNRTISTGGEQKTLAEWEEVANRDRATIASRIDRDGWTPEEAVTTPAGKRLRAAKGERHGSAVLTADDVREVRRRRAVGETILALSLCFGVSKTTIGDIVKRRTWGHVE